MSKLLFVMNMAPKYVESSYKLFDQEFDVLWCFGKNDTDIKEMDHSLLKKVYVLPVRHFYKGAYSLKGLFSLAFRNKIDNYVLIGQPALISTWVLPWIIKVFYPKRKVLFWSHGWYGKEGKIKTILKKLYYKPADKVLTYGDYARNLMINVGFSPNKVFAIHNSLNHNEQVALRNTIKPSTIYKYHFKNDNPVLFFVGRLTPVKNLSLLLYAVKMLKDNEKYYNVVFVGDGSERESLNNLAKKLGLEEETWFYGACYDEKTNAELIYNADLCVAPGNIGLTAMHVLVFGTPALTHNDFKWQMPEFEAIHEGETGCFFERDNVESLAETITKWFKEKRNKREEVRRACYKEIDDNWTPEYELKVLNKALQS